MVGHFDFTVREREREYIKYEMYTISVLCHLFITASSRDSRHPKLSKKMLEARNFFDEEIEIFAHAVATDIHKQTREEGIDCITRPGSGGVVMVKIVDADNCVLMQSTN